MTTKIYIGLPYTYTYKGGQPWPKENGKSLDIWEIVRRDFSADKCIFVLNKLSGLYDGDTYQLTYNNDMDIMWFKLKYNVDILKEEDVIYSILHGDDRKSVIYRKNNLELLAKLGINSCSDT